MYALNGKIMVNNPIIIVRTPSILGQSNFSFKINLDNTRIKTKLSEVIAYIIEKSIAFAANDEITGPHIKKILPNKKVGCLHLW